METTGSGSKVSANCPPQYRRFFGCVLNWPSCRSDRPFWLFTRRYRKWSDSVAQKQLQRRLHPMHGLTLWRAPQHVPQDRGNLNPLALPAPRDCREAHSTKAEMIGGNFVRPTWRRIFRACSRFGWGRLGTDLRADGLSQPCQRPPRCFSPEEKASSSRRRPSILFVNRRIRTEILFCEAGSRDPAGRRCLVSDDALDARFAGGAARIIGIGAFRFLRNLLAATLCLFASSALCFR